MSNENARFVMYLASLTSGVNDESPKSNSGDMERARRQFPGGNMNNGKAVKGLGDGGVE